MLLKRKKNKLHTTVMLEIYTGIKVCVLVNFEVLKELCDIYLCVLDQGQIAILRELKSCDTKLCDLITTRINSINKYRA